VAGLLADPCARNITWSRDDQDLRDVLNVFVSGERGVDVFRAWLDLSYVRDLLEKQRFVDWRVPGQYGTFVHALAHCKRFNLLQELRRRSPDNSKLNVSHSMDVGRFL
jgi:hypothetical protein